MKRRSALAQLVALYAERGITSVKQLVEITGYSDRQIWRARGELTDARDSDTSDAGVTDTPDADVTDTPDAGVSVSDGSSPLKKKGLPHTPSKEKTNPPPPRLVERESPTTTLTTRGEQHHTDDFEKCQPLVTQLARALYPNCPYPDRAGIEKFLRAALATGHTVAEVRTAASILIGKAIDDEEIHKPAALFMRILGDVRRDGSKGKRRMPLGAIRLGPDEWLSKW